MKRWNGIFLLACVVASAYGLLVLAMKLGR